MAGVTNRGKFLLLRWALVNTAAPVNAFVHLLTPATAPTAGTNNMAAVTQITDGNGYNTAGYTLTRNDTSAATFVLATTAPTVAKYQSIGPTLQVTEIEAPDLRVAAVAAPTLRITEEF